MAPDKLLQRPVDVDGFPAPFQIADVNARGAVVSCL